MEIKYDNFNKWIEIGYELTRPMSSDLISDEHWASYGTGEKPKITEEEAKRFKNEGRRLRKDVTGVEIWVEITEEIDLNIANLPSNENIVRYLNYLKKKLDAFIFSIKDQSYYNYLVYYADKFHKNKPYMDKIIIPPIPGEKNEDVTVEGLEYDDDPLTKYISELKGTVGNYEEIIEYIDENIFKILPTHKSTEDSPVIEDESNLKRLIADRHKLILLQRTGVFKFLTDKFMNPKQPLMIQEDFKRLIENMIGATTKDIGSDVGKLINENIDPKKKKSIENRTAVNAVNAFLASLGLTV